MCNGVAVRPLLRQRSAVLGDFVQAPNWIRDVDRRVSVGEIGKMLTIP